jgi:nucleoside-diphosphate-sugar epimerase
MSPVLGVDYQRGDVFDAAATQAQCSGAMAVVSCIGGFGDNAAMERINGDANIAAATAAKAAGVPKFVYVSVFQYNLPEFITAAIGYFVGKRKAEKAVLAAYSTDATILQPGFIYGDRAVGSTSLPLGLVGQPVEQLLTGSLGKALKPLGALPGSDVVLAPPVSVDAVAAAAVACATGRHPAGVYDIDAINRIAEGKSV